jgi:REP element-mobilizing transposase RayT
MEQISVGGKPVKERTSTFVSTRLAYHLTRRCHNREFILKFAMDRQRCRIRLREALLEVSVALLTYRHRYSRCIAER